MKKTSLIFVMCLLPFLGYAQFDDDEEGIVAIGFDYDIEGVEPVDAEMMTFRLYDYEHYLKQSMVWKKQTEAKPHDASAWLNYFRYSRYTCFFDYEIDRDSLLTSIVDDMGKVIPDTYVYNTCKYFIRNTEDGLNEYAEKALKQLPAKMTFFDYDTWYCYLRTKKDKSEYEPFGKEYLASGLYSQELIKHNMNELDGLAKNAIYVGNGDATVIPKWLIADAMGKHRDKLVLCYPYLQDPEYCKRIFNALGIGEVPQHEGEFEYYEDYQNYIKSIIMTIAERTGRELYFSKNNGEDINDLWFGDVYDEGLVFHYSPKEIDAMKMKKHNYEKVYDLSYLLQPMGDNAWNTDKRMCVQMIPSFGDLLSYYKANDKKRYSELYSMLSHALERSKDIIDESDLDYFNDILNGEFE